MEYNVIVNEIDQFIRYLRLEKKSEQSLQTGSRWYQSNSAAAQHFRGDLLYIGILLMFYHWTLPVLSVGGIVLFHLQIVNAEEEVLLMTFGDAYLEYRKKGISVLR